jgi:hypothetical protein
MKSEKIMTNKEKFKILRTGAFRSCIESGMSVKEALEIDRKAMEAAKQELKHMSIRRNNKTIEVMADVEHSRWSKWQKYLHSLCVKNSDGSLTIPKERVLHWEKEIATSYKDLSEELKDFDRQEALTTIKALKENKLLITDTPRRS